VERPGYYSRARNLHRCAQELVAGHDGQFPREPEQVARLPGIGRSTAAAICAFAFGTRAAILDGNVKRVLARHAGIEGYPGERQVELQLWDAAQQRLPDRDIGDYTQGLMDLGATLCTRRPDCARCPVAGDCNALATDRVLMLPAPRPKKVVPRRAVTMLLLTQHESVLVERRPATGIWGGLWSLPELPDGIPADAYCAARFAAAVQVDVPLAAIEHGFTHFRLTITPQPCRVLSWNPRAEEPGLLWLPLMEAERQHCRPRSEFLTNLNQQQLALF
jgi:A/G-specific adenine glycosylase